MRRFDWMAVTALWFALAPVAGAQTAAPQQSSQTQTKQSASAPNKGKTATPANAAKAASPTQNAGPAKPKAPFVFTNDNIPRASGTVSVMGTMDNPAKASAAQNAKDEDTGDEQMWKAKFSAAREKLKQDQSKLNMMRDDFRTLQQQRYADVNEALAHATDPNEYSNMQQGILDQQKQVMADQQAISDLQDALRRAGGDPAWGQ